MSTKILTPSDHEIRQVVLDFNHALRDCDPEDASMFYDVLNNKAPKMRQYLGENFNPEDDVWFFNGTIKVPDGIIFIEDCSFEGNVYKAGHFLYLDYTAGIASWKSDEHMLRDIRFEGRFFLPNDPQIRMKCMPLVDEVCWQNCMNCHINYQVELKRLSLNIEGVCLEM